MADAAYRVRVYPVTDSQNYIIDRKFDNKSDAERFSEELSGEQSILDGLPFKAVSLRVDELHNGEWCQMRTDLLCVGRD